MKINTKEFNFIKNVKIKFMKYDIKNIGLAEEGLKKIIWAGTDMPVLNGIKADFKKDKPFKNITIGACLHVTAETANLMIALKEGGAKVFLCASNPLSTNDAVAASLVKNFSIPVFAIKGEDNKTYFKHLNAVLDEKPDITMDDGADLVSEIHKNRPLQIKNLKGSTEETTTGVIRLKAMAKAGALGFPVVAVNDSLTKHLFDNRYGTGQSTIDGMIRATNRLIAGSNFVVAGYGWCGRGLALRARGMGANVIVTEIDSVKALEAVMDGFRVMPIVEASKQADFICTVTGNISVVDEKVFRNLKDGCIVANSGHFDVEIDLKALKKMAKSKNNVGEYVEEYILKNGKKVFILAEGRLVNLGSADGHPASVMDMSFANQAYGALFILHNHKKLENKVYTLPEEIDQKIALLKLGKFKIKIDKLSPLQKKYLASWQEGTS